MSKARAGNFFEDFTLGQEIVHATPRTVTAGDVAIYTALYGSRFALHTSDEFARGLGYARAPLDDLLVFHLVFGKTVPDISLNAIANLGYAACDFGRPVYPGDTITTSSEVTGLKENSNRKTGVVYVRSSAGSWSASATRTRRRRMPSFRICRRRCWPNTWRRPKGSISPTTTPGPRARAISGRIMRPASGSITWTP
jgi:acyl dehydratase